MRLREKVALITGAASGIGKACVEKFLEEGASVMATDINQDALNGLNGPGLATSVGNVCKREDAEQLVSQTVAQFGRLDILINSAGITARNVGPDADFEEKWDAVLEVNVKGSMLMSHAAVDAMRQNPGGAIINMGSIMGLVGYPTSLPFSDGFNPYPVSKGAISQFTKDLTGDTFDMRELDTIRVVGKTEPVTTYDLLGVKGKTEPDLVDLKDTFHQGLALYKQQKWDEAISVFKRSLELEYKRFPGLKGKKTNPSLIYIDRCEAFKADPPETDWDGVYTLTSK